MYVQAVIGSQHVSPVPVHLLLDFECMIHLGLILSSSLPFCFQTKYKTHEPLWEETFTFLIHNPKVQELEVEV